MNCGRVVSRSFVHSLTHSLLSLTCVRRPTCVRGRECAHARELRRLLAAHKARGGGACRCSLAESRSRRGTAWRAPTYKQQLNRAAVGRKAASRHGRHRPATLNDLGGRACRDLLWPRVRLRRRSCSHGRQERGRV
eukprot:scaffold51_cov401-Prasinococcus_capsulatus_cf.AAC.5